MGEDATGEPRANQRLTVAQAATALDITEGALRSRIKRGTLPTVKEGGTVYVMLGGGTSKANHPPHTDEPPDQEPKRALVESLQDQVTYLRQQLDAEREENRRKDHLLAAALERIPAIEAPEPRDAPDSEAATTSDEPSTEQPASDTGQPRASWWRRWFGFR